ncbi:MAG: enoyl-CoA hydratase/isomerase family protein [Acidimicrobiales bacterium]
MREDAPIVGETRGAVRWVRFNRPSKLNAMTRAMAEALRSELGEAAAAEDTRVLVITGTGRAFSAGADRREVLEGPGATIRERRRAPLWPVDELVTFPKPLVACLNGPAYGGGATLAMAADLRVAAAGAGLAFNLARAGLTPEFGSSYLLWRQVGYAVALDLMLTGRMVAAPEALTLRLVNTVVPDPEVVDATQSLAESLASLPAGTAEATKAVLRAGLEADFPQARRNELKALAERGRALADDVGQEVKDP